MTDKRRIFAVVLLAGLLRFPGLGSTPPGVYVDEALQGYNAYSLRLTGRDHYGQAWPVVTKLFGSYSSSLYTYFSVVPVGLMGLNPVSARISSAVSGILLVLLVSAALSPLTGLIIAVSPVFVYFSRGAFEANLGLLLLVAGIFTSQKAVRRQAFLPWGFALLSLSAYAYHAERFLSLVFLGWLSWTSRRAGLATRSIIISLALALIIQTPLLWLSVHPAVNTRLHELVIPGSPSQKVVAVVKSFGVYFSPDNLFSRPDPDIQRSFPDLGVFYWWMVIPFLAGIWHLFRSQPLSPKSRLMLILLFLSVIPGSLTRDYFASLRVLPAFFSVAWIISQGLSWLKVRPVWLGMFVILSLLELYSNMVLLQHERSSVWNYEYRELAGFIKRHPDLPVVIDSSRAKPVYILLAFYNRFPPLLFQSQYPSSWLKNYYSHPEFDPDIEVLNIHIRPISWAGDIYRDQLLIGDQLAISSAQAEEHFLELVAEFRDINGHPALTAYRTHPQSKCRATQSTPSSYCRDNIR